MEELKSFENLCKYDNNFLAAYYNQNMIKEYYNEISKIKIKLNDNVSEQIKVGFTNVIYLLIYSMYYRNFNTIAKEHAFIVLESALKDVYCKITSYHAYCKKNIEGLNKLLTFFITGEKKLICIDDIESECMQISIQQQKNNEKIITELAEKIMLEPYEVQYEIKKISTNKLNPTQKIELICHERNQLAHNSESNYINGKEWIEVCAKIINKLYNIEALNNNKEF